MSLFIYLNYIYLNIIFLNDENKIDLIFKYSKCLFNIKFRSNKMKQITKMLLKYY